MSKCNKHDIALANIVRGFFGSMEPEAIRLWAKMTRVILRTEMQENTIDKLMEKIADQLEKEKKDV